MEIEHTKTTTRPPKSLLGIGLAMLLAAATFFSGLQLGSGMSLEASVGSLFTAEASPSPEVPLGEFWKIWEILENKHVGKTPTTTVSVEDRVHGAIGGLVDSYGDPYTVYFPPAEAEAFAEEISGNFGGVGMEVGMRDGIVTVIAPLPGTPAHKAGILAGDAIIKIDDKTTEGMNTDEAVRLIRGEKGTIVRLTIYREGDTEMRDFEITRDNIVVPTIKTEVKGDVFVIALYSFNAIAEVEMQNALREYVKSGKTKLIFDLRGNPGGYLEAAVSIASYFLPMGEVVVRENFGATLGEKVYRSQGKELGSHAPRKMVVLIDGGSASASEIVAGALKEHEVATLIGETTFGKGSVQELVELEDGSSLKVTIAHWLTPNGNSISDGGLSPNIEVARTPEDREAEKDPQMEKALEFLR